MHLSHKLSVGLAAVVLLLTASSALAQDRDPVPSSSPIKHVLLISIDGMHSLDFANCVNGVPAFGNDNYCPHLTALASTGVHYLQALTPKPSDSFPGLVARSPAGRRAPLECTTTSAMIARSRLRSKRRLTALSAGPSFAPA